MIRTILLAVFLIASTTRTYAQWETILIPGQHQCYNRSFDFVNARKGMISGLRQVANPAGPSLSYPYILRTNNSGSSWDTVYQSSNPQPFYYAQSTVKAIDSNIFIATIDSSRLFITHDFGNTWDSVSINTTAYFLDFPVPQKGFYFGNGQLYSSSDTGATWQLVQSSLPSFINLQFFNDTFGAAIANSSIYRTIDGGQNWTMVYQTNTGIFDISIPDISIAYAISYAFSTNDTTIIYKSIDTCQTWVAIDSTDAFNFITDMEFSSADHGYFTGFFQLQHSADGGESWVHQSATPPFSGFFDWVEALCFISEDTGLALGHSGIFYRTYNGGHDYDSAAYAGMFPGTMIESCQNLAALHLELSKPLSTPYTFYIDKLGGTATEGVDFSTFPDSVVFQPGDTFQVITIQPISDIIPEPTETFTIVVRPTSSGADTLTLYIINDDPTLVSISASDTIMCWQDSIQLTAQPSGGSGSYSFVWQPSTAFGQPQSQVSNASPQQSGWLYVRANGSYCQPSGRDSIYIHVGYPSHIQINQSICQGDSTFYGGNWHSSPGNYPDTIITAYGCDSIVELLLQVHPTPNVSLASFSPDSICKNAGLIPLPAGSPPGGIYTGPGVNNLNFSPLLADTGSHWIWYQYTNSNGCTDSASTQISVLDCSSIAEQENGDEFVIYPVPAQDHITLKYTTAFSDICYVILDVNGRAIESSELNTPGAGAFNEVLINLNACKPGVYLIRVFAVGQTLWSGTFSIVN